MLSYQFSRIAGNGSDICDGAVIAFRQPIFALKLNRITKVEHLMSSRTIVNNMLAVGLSFTIYFYYRSFFKYFLANVTIRQFKLFN